jgi:hypothetical protein
MPVKGVKEVNQNIKRFIDKARGPITEVTLTKVLIAGAAHAARITPKGATGNLLESGFRRVIKSAGGMSGMVGYTAEYAAAVHEATGKLKGSPRPKVKGVPQGNFWDPFGEPEFLRKGFERDGLGEIKRIIAQGYKV